MPIFDYLCTSCGWQQELTVKRFDDVVFCEHCGEQPRRLVSAAAFKFKGQVVQGGGPDRFTADMMGIPLKELPDDMKASAPLVGKTMSETT